jgi:hypothetical protein
MGRTDGEFATFAGARLRHIEPADPMRAHEVRSAQVIDLMASRIRGASIESAARVVDGFWDYVADVAANYRPAAKGPYLVIPHFGTFRLRETKSETPPGDRLFFRSFSTADRVSTRVETPKGRGCLLALFTKPPEPTEPPARIDRAGVGTGWVEHADSPRLSVKRRMAARIAETSGVDPLLTARLLDSLLGICLLLFDRDPRFFGPGGPVIRWARRGSMKRRESDPPGVYCFVSSPSFARRLRRP